MNVNDLTVGQAKELAAMFGGPCCGPWEVGAKYLIRTVTHHYTGQLVAVYADELVLSSAAWIPDDGRFAQTVEAAVSGDASKFAEVEPYPEGSQPIIGRKAILDAVKIGAVPRSQK